MKTDLDNGTKHVAGVIKDLLGRHVIDPATEAIEAALPGAGSTADTAQLVSAEAHARALARSRRLARQVGLDGRANAAVTAIQDRLRASIGQALDSAGPAGGASEQVAFSAIHILELVAGQPEAEKYLRLMQKRRAAA
jgi:hypothetical protein